MPSWRLRSIRRRVSSDAATTRAREAASSSQACAFEMAIATSSAKSSSRASASTGRGCCAVEEAAIMPHTRPCTTTGLPTVVPTFRLRAKSAASPFLPA